MDGAAPAPSGTAQQPAPMPYPTAPAQQGPGPALAPLTPEQFAEDHSSAIVGAAIACIVLCLALVAARLALRRVRRAGMRLSDWVLLAGIAFSVATASCFIWSAKEGAGLRFLAVVATDPSLQKAGRALEVRSCRLPLATVVRGRGRVANRNRLLSLGRCFTLVPSRVSGPHRAPDVIC